MGTKCKTRTNQHPECKEGEIFIGNEMPEGMHLLERFKTLRVGKVAYRTDDKVARGYFPLFVSEEEYLEDKKKKEYMRSRRWLGLRKTALVVSPMIEEAIKVFTSELARGDGGHEILDDIEVTCWLDEDAEEKKDIITLLNAICAGSTKLFRLLRTRIEEKNPELFVRLIKAGLQEPINTELMQKMMRK
ncbi:MAG: hypothetical protein WC238_01560 [Parcubacteria group bacterium]